jgi:filamentous hemagglutinin family protein
MDMGCACKLGRRTIPANFGGVMPRKNRKSAALRPTRVALAVGAAFLSSQAVLADPATNQLPTGGSVAAGTVTISTTGSKMQIDQASDRAIINWQNFSIGSSGWVNFSQPSASSVALNRSTQPAEIFGRLSANGQVFVTSSAGVYFARSAAVDVGGLVASNLSIRDQDFMSGRYVFVNEGATGKVVNDGQITITTVGGYAALAGTQVQNNGIIVAQAGTVALAAGDRITLDMVGDGLVKVSVDAAALNALALNAGTIQADGGRVVLTARSANALLDTVINNTGVIRARSLVERNGEIVLDGGSAGVVANSGSIDATGTAGTSGGSVQVQGQYVALTQGSSVDASGDAGGGTVTVKATDAAFVYGTISARDTSGNGNGGSVETSGHYLEVTQAPEVGAGGTWLIDPYNIDVVAVAPPPGFSNNTGPTTFTPVGDNSQIAASLITSQLNAGANVTLDTGGAGSPGAQAGDIRVLAAIDKTVANPASLALKAFHDVQIDQPISIASAFGPTGFGTLTIDAGNNVVVSAPITTEGGGLRITADGFTNQSAINNGVGAGLLPGMSITANRFNLAGGTINGGLGSVGLFTRTATNSMGVESAGDTTITNADIASITTAPDSPLTNANQLLISTGGSMRIGDNAQVNGGSKNLVLTAGSGAGVQVAVGANGVTSTGDVAITGGSIAATGTISGNHVALRASTGIGAPTGRVSTAANTLAINTGGNAYVSEADNVALDNVVVAGASVSNSVSGTLDFAASGSVTVGGVVFAGSGMNVNVAQDLNVVGTPGRSAILTTNGQQAVTASNISLQGAASGTNGRAIIANTNGTADQAINVTGTLRISGGDGGVQNTAAILTNGNQAINGNAEITLTAGASGTGSVAAQTQNSASIQSNGAGKTQTINAAKITLRAGGGNDTFASISAANQLITVGGDVDIKGGSGTGASIARIGGIGTPAGATNLSLSARDVTITGGDAVTGEAGLGGTVLGTGPQPNTINVSASRDVTLNGGTGGARIALRSPSRQPRVVTFRSAPVRDNPAHRRRGHGGDPPQQATWLCMRARSAKASNGGIVATPLVRPQAEAPAPPAEPVSSYSGNAGDLSLANTGSLNVTGLGQWWQCHAEQRRNVHRKRSLDRGRRCDRGRWHRRQLAARGLWAAIGFSS